ncbi:MAG TPA: LON peptidase substrate-binding domain-containing protein [Thermoanaerobaculia bacterium]|nr:LON peptidase substrate-binding domain-containing protein [Thermoanaerobaculia bacterium]
MGGDHKRLPLIPLPDVVHFPRTELRLHVAEPRYQLLVHDVSERDEGWIGLVLLKPNFSRDAEGRLEIFPGGTAARLMDVEERPDGHTNVILHGEFRFELAQELGGGPYRQALVKPVAEPWLNERDAGIVAVRTAIVELVHSLSDELGDGFPLSAEEVVETAFEEMVNRIAAELDLPALRKLQLLIESLPERGLSILSILKSRQQVMDLLRPFRRLSAGSEHN